MRREIGNIIGDEKSGGGIEKRDREFMTGTGFGTENKDW